MVHMGSMQHFQMSHVGVRFCSVVEDVLVTQVIGLSKMYRVFKFSGLLHRGASFRSCQPTFPSPQPGWDRSSHPPHQKGAHLPGTAPDFKAPDVQGSPATALHSVSRSPVLPPSSPGLCSAAGRSVRSLGTFSVVFVLTRNQSNLVRTAFILLCAWAPCPVSVLEILCASTPCRSASWRLDWVTGQGVPLWGSVSAPGIFFEPLPTRACFCPHLTKQFGVPSRCVLEFGPSFAPGL